MSDCDKSGAYDVFTVLFNDPAKINDKFIKNILFFDFSSCHERYTFLKLLKFVVGQRIFIADVCAENYTHFGTLTFINYWAFAGVW